MALSRVTRYGNKKKWLRAALLSDRDLTLMRRERVPAGSAHRGTVFSGHLDIWTGKGPIILLPGFTATLSSFKGEKKGQIAGDNWIVHEKGIAQLL
jgi:hypothetical protein